jgi:hypothetical protein
LLYHPVEAGQLFDISWAKQRGKTNREMKPVPQGYNIQKRINEVSTKSITFK